MIDSKTLAMEIGAKIRKLRLQRGMSLEKLALSCDMNAAFLGHVERGMRCPTIYTLYRICEGLQIGLDELFVTDSLTTQNAGAIAHISKMVQPLPPDKAQAIAEMVEAALKLSD